MIFAALGFLANGVSRYLTFGRTVTVVLALVDGTAGLLIFTLSIVLSLQGMGRPGFVLVRIGCGLMGIGGLLQAFLPADRPLVSANTIYTVLPTLLLFMTGACAVGLAIA